MQASDCGKFSTWKPFFPSEKLFFYPKSFFINLKSLFKSFWQNFSSQVGAKQSRPKTEPRSVIVIGQQYSADVSSRKEKLLKLLIHFPRQKLFKFLTRFPGQKLLKTFNPLPGQLQGGSANHFEGRRWTLLQSVSSHLQIINHHYWFSRSSRSSRSSIIITNSHVNFWSSLTMPSNRGSSRSVAVIGAGARKRR